MENGHRKAQEMEQVVKMAGDVISRMSDISEKAQAQASAISRKAQEVEQVIETIETSTRQQREFSSQVLKAVSGLTVVSQQHVQGSMQISSNAANLEDMSHRLVTM